MIIMTTSRHNTRAHKLMVARRRTERIRRPLEQALSLAPLTPEQLDEKVKTETRTKLRLLTED